MQLLDHSGLVTGNEKFSGLLHTRAAGRTVQLIVLCCGRTNSSHSSRAVHPDRHPGAGAAHVWLSIPFTCIYTVSLAGNCTTLFVIETDPSLHEPVYCFLSMLATTIFGFVSLYKANVLILYIPMVGLSMAHQYGKYASPLVHVVTANVHLLVSPVLNPIIYSIKPKQIHRVFTLSSLLVLLYIMILKTVLSIASQEEWSRALNTCASHICPVLIFDIPVIGLSMIHKFGKNASPTVHILMADICLLVPMMNVTVHSVKTK
ncbi:LOW QUALITY PROTEIN: olfactory receptor 51A4-like [Phoenicopterus ruber ruber]